MGEDVGRRVELRPRQLGVEHGLLDTRGADTEVGVVRDGFGDRGKRVARR